MRKQWTTFLATTALALVTSAAVAAPAEAANPNPIRWDVYTTLFSAGGGDVPLRYGQEDHPSGPGFGTRHIEGKHELWGNWTDTANKIEETIQDGNCTTSGSTVTCSMGTAYRFVAAYSTRVDSRSGDGRPVGVITFYWFCNTCAPGAQ